MNSLFGYTLTGVVKNEDDHLLLRDEGNLPLPLPTSTGVAAAIMEACIAAAMEASREVDQKKLMVGGTDSWQTSPPKKAYDLIDGVKHNKV